MALLMVVVMAGCGATEGAEPNVGSQASETEAQQSEVRTVTYLGQTYEVPAHPERIAVLAVEALEEVKMLGVKPYIAAKDIYVNGVPEEIGDLLDGDVQWIETGGTPDKEQLLALQPDVILTSARFDADLLKSLNEIAPTIPLSFSGADTEANMTVVGEITGKTEEAKQAIADYHAQLEQAREQLARTDMKDKNIMYLRISTAYGLGGYSPDTTYNEVLYKGLGLTVPEVIANIERRETLPLEVLAQENPDYIFALVPLNDLKAMDDLAAKPLWNQIQAVKDGHVIVNPVHPDLFGAPILSKTKFLEQVTEHLTHDQ